MVNFIINNFDFLKESFMGSRALQTNARHGECGVRWGLSDHRRNRRRHHPRRPLFTDAEIDALATFVAHNRQNAGVLPLVVDEILDAESPGAT